MRWRRPSRSSNALAGRKQGAASAGRLPRRAARKCTRRRLRGRRRVCRRPAGDSDKPPFSCPETGARHRRIRPLAQGRPAQYAVLRRVGRDAWNALNARPGAAAFVKEFFGDRAWMEDFAWSGACTDWPKAILAQQGAVRSRRRLCDGQGPASEGMGQVDGRTRLRASGQVSAIVQPSGKINRPVQK